MAAFAGKSGTVTYATGYAANVYSWSADVTADVLESTAFAGDGFKTFLPGLNNWSGSFESRLDDTVTTKNRVGAAAAEAIFLGTAGVSITGDIIITGASYSVAVDGIATITWSFQGTGAPTIIPV